MGTARRYDDLYQEENDEVKMALKRLSPKESYDRIFRIRRAVQCSYQQKVLPKDEWTKPEEVCSCPLTEQYRRNMQEISADSSPRTSPTCHLSSRPLAPSSRRRRPSTPLRLLRGTKRIDIG